MKRWLIILVVLVLAGAGAWGWWSFRKHEDHKRYRTARLERGDVVQTVRATGLVQPIKLVQVGTQVTGPIQKLYVDFNDQVKEGQLVAQIDPTVYEAHLAQDQANLLQSMAGVDQAQAKLTQAEKELTRSQELSRRDLLSQSDLDGAVANRDALAAQLKVAHAQVEQAQASLRVSKANLDYTTIRSPVDGVVISRNVSEGQTVVASTTAQTIFLVATDLRHVQVEASIPEADIGKIKMAQPVTFTVDAFDEDFQGKVAQIRLASATVQNVVTYPVIILAENPENKLFPGMTANISCEVARRSGVLKLPNAALRFKPEPAPGSQAKAPSKDKDTESHGGKGPKLWVQESPDAAPTPVRVKLGISDGSFTELTDAGTLAAGQEVITGLADASAGGGAQQGVVNPFAPRPPGAAGGGRPR